MPDPDDIEFTHEPGMGKIEARGRLKGEPERDKSYAAPIGAFSCPEIRAFTGFGARFLQPFPKFLVTVKYYSNSKMPINSR